MSCLLHKNVHLRPHSRCSSRTYAHPRCIAKNARGILCLYCNCSTVARSCVYQVCCSWWSDDSAELVYLVYCFTWRHYYFHDSRCLFIMGWNHLGNHLFQSDRDSSGRLCSSVWSSCAASSPDTLNPYKSRGVSVASSVSASSGVSKFRNRI